MDEHMDEIRNRYDISPTGNNIAEAVPVKQISIGKVDLSDLLHGNSRIIKEWEADWNIRLNASADHTIILFNQCIKPNTKGKFMSYQQEAIVKDRPEEAWSETLMTAISFALHNAMGDSERTGRTATKIEITSHIAKDTLTIEVKDDGEGIPANTASKLNPGYTLKKPEDEVGDRLRYIYEAVEQIGGRVELVTKRIEDLKPGETSGTTVRFFFSVNNP